MKKQLMSLVLLIATCGLGSPAFAVGSTKTVELRISDVIVPTGLTSTQEAYVIVTTLLPGCYTWQGSQVTDEGNNIIDVTSYATVTSGICPQYMLFFHKTIDLGMLPAGDYLIRFMNSDGSFLQEPLTIQ